LQPEYVAPHRLLRRALAVGGDRPRAPSSHCGKLILASLFAVLPTKLPLAKRPVGKKNVPGFGL
jgi:hypothetical protein